MLPSELMSDFKWIAGLRCTCDDGLFDTAIDLTTGARLAKGVPHSICQGTGYRFPWLWRRCGGISVSPQRGELEFMHDERCCNGTGYVLIEGKGERLLGLLKVMWKANFIVQRWYPDEIILVPRDKPDNTGWVGYGSEQVALASALVSVLGSNSDTEGHEG